jgi:hypothetical protein
MLGKGFLAIWSDLAPEDETDWAHWMTREHSSERLGIEGFLGCRIFRAVGATVNRYFILYDLATQDVVDAAQYLARLNAPTPWSQRIMPRLRNFARGGGQVLARAGIGQGGVLAVIPLHSGPTRPDEIATLMASTDRIAAAHILVTDAAQTSVETREKGMRSGDASFAALLLVEGLDENTLRTALWRLRTAAAEIDVEAMEAQPIYRMCFSLQRR